MTTWELSQGSLSPLVFPLSDTWYCRMMPESMNSFLDLSSHKPPVTRRWWLRRWALESEDSSRAPPFLSNDTTTWEAGETWRDMGAFSTVPAQRHGNNRSNCNQNWQLLTIISHLTMIPWSRYNYFHFIGEKIMVKRD